MEPDTYEGYCVKCKDKQTFEAAEVAVTKNGTPMAKGPCPECGTTICRNGISR